MPRPEVNVLESRITPTGTMVITHGLSLTSQFGSDSWVRAMGNAIAARSPGPDVFLMYDFAAGEMRYDGGAKVASDFQAGNDEYIVYVSWESASSRQTPGWAETTAEGLYGTLRRYGLADANHPLHFIGHSYGTVVNSEVIQRLGYLDGQSVDQMTTLDPHDFYEVFTGSITPNYEANIKQPDVHVWSNIRYADNYYNLSGTSTLFSPLPHGRPLDGAMDKAAINVNLSNLNGFLNVNGAMPHTRVHEYYALTIDPNINIFDPGQNTSTWFVPGPSTNYGFRYSRLGVASTAGGSEADRVAHWNGNTQRTSLAAPPDNSANDVGQDPPSRIYNGDFFNTMAGSGLLAGYTGSPQITGSPANPAALLNNSGKSFTHLPVYIPDHAESFAFDFGVSGPPSSDSLVITFQRDDNQSFTYTANGLLQSAGTGSLNLNAANFPALVQLQGRMASINFTLNTTQSITSLSVDNLRLNLPSITSTQVNDGSNQRSIVTSLSVEFSALVTLPTNAADAFTVVGPNGQVPVSVDTSGSTATQTKTRLTFSGPGTLAGSLTDGNYVLTVLGNQITLGDQALNADNDGTPGGNFAFTFHRLFGDADGNRSVTAADFNAFRLAYGQSGPSIFDFNGDGTVSASDFNDFRMRFGATLLP